MASRKKHLTGWITAIAVAFLLLTLMRVFFIQVHVVHNTYMSNALLPGDMVFINKIVYGPRLPETPLTVPYTEIYSDKIQLPYLRFPGKGTIARNDIIAFNYPLDSILPPDKRPVYTKRLIGIPGDVVSISAKKVYVNHRLVSLPDVKYAYLVKCSSSGTINEIIKKYELTEGGIVDTKGIYKLFLTPRQASIIDSFPGIEYVKLSLASTSQDFLFNAPVNSTKRWNHDYIPPFVVPGKNITISLTPDKIWVYETVIRFYEHRQLTVKDSLIFINGQPASYYTFSGNYYFVLDDNRDNANDSRNWGFLPEQFIIGKVTRILCSFDFEAPWWKTIRWKRTGKKP